MILEILIGIVGAIILIIAGIKLYPHKMPLVWSQGLFFAALIYVGFAAFGQNTEWIKIELLGVLIYGAFAWLAVKKSVLFLSAGWGLHVLWDILLHPGGHPGYVPNWYPGACLGFDIVIAAFFVGYYMDKKKMLSPND